MLVWTTAPFPTSAASSKRFFTRWGNACPILADGPSAQPKEALLLPTASTRWTARVWQEFRAGNLTRTARDVLLTLATYRGHGGLICPSHETLAERVDCHPVTVWRALQAARELGLVRWTERHVRAAWRRLRTSNRYRLLLPEAPVAS